MRKELDSDELEVQTDRVLEYYGLNVNANKLSLDHLTEFVLKHERSFKKRLKIYSKLIENFSNPENLKWYVTGRNSWILNHSLKSTFKYCEFHFPKQYFKGAVIEVCFYRAPLRKGYVSETYRCEMDSSFENCPLELDKIKKFCIDHLKNIGFNLPKTNPGDDNAQM